MVLSGRLIPHARVQEAADQQMALFTAALAATSASATNLASLDHSEMQRQTEMTKFKLELESQPRAGWEGGRHGSGDSDAASSDYSAMHDNDFASEKSIQALVERLAGNGDRAFPYNP